jgi:hypothetical protein
MESEFLDIFQSKDNVISVFKDNYGNKDYLLNEGGGLKTHSCNHFTVTIDQRNLKTYLNGVIRHKSINIVNGIRPKDETIKFDSFSGRMWDIKIYNKILSEEQISNLAENCIQEPIKEPYDKNYPKPLCLVYTCLWADRKTDLTLDKFQYYLQTMEKAFIDNIFEVGMYPKGKLEQYVTDENSILRNLIISDDIIKKFINPYSFSNRLTYKNANYLLHENFYSYQKNLIKSNGYNVDKWFLKSSADWVADAYFSGALSIFLAYYTLNPHQSMWVKQHAQDTATAGHQFSGGHMYGSAIFQSYLTNYVVDKSFIGEVFNEEGKNAVERFYKVLKRRRIDIKEVFADFAAKTVIWDYTNGGRYKSLEFSGLKRMRKEKKGLPRYDNKIIQTFDQKGTSGVWETPPAGFAPGSWAYNVYKLEVRQKDQNYKIEFKGNALNPDYTDFRLRIVVHAQKSSIDNKRKYYETPISKDIVFAKKSVPLHIPAKVGDDVYLVIVTTPTNFAVAATTKYQYSYKITAIKDNKLGTKN